MCPLCPLCNMCVPCMRLACFNMWNNSFSVTSTLSVGNFFFDFVNRRHTACVKTLQTLCIKKLLPWQQIQQDRIERITCEDPLETVGMTAQRLEFNRETLCVFTHSSNCVSASEFFWLVFRRFLGSDNKTIQNLRCFWVV